MRNNLKNLSRLINKKIAKRIAIYLFSLLLITLLLTQDWSINVNGWKQFKINVINIFNPTNQSTYNDTNESYNLFLTSLAFLWISIKYTLVGTFLGFFLAIITSFFASIFFSNKIIEKFSLFFTLLIRCVPELLYIYLFSSIFNSYLALCFIMFFFSWIWIHKYLLEILNSVDLKNYNISCLQGNSKIKSFFIKIYPIIKNRYLERFLYSFESNLRWGSIVSLIGLPGIGILIKYAQESVTTFNQFLIPSLILWFFLVFLELINLLFKRFLFEDINRKFNENRIIFNLRNIILKILFIILLSFCIYILSGIEFRVIYSKALINKLKSIFYIKASVFFINNPLEENIYYSIWQSVSFSLVCAALSILFSIFWVRFSNIHLNKRWLFLSFRSLNTFFRSIPIIIIFYILNPLFNNPILLLIFILAMHKSLSFAKQMTQSVDSINKNIINNLKMQMHSNSWIFYKYILVKLRAEYVSIFLIALELSFRYSLTYSIIASDNLIIGSKIANIFNEKINDISLYTPYLWISILLIFLLNLISFKFSKNKKL